MIRHWAFFRDSDALSGAFYPCNYIVAGYPSLARAHAAEAAFNEAGVAADDVRAASGDFVVNQLEAHRSAHRTQRAPARTPRHAVTEMDFLDRDAALARRDGAFLFVYAPQDADVAQARAVLARHPPLYARRYVQAGIERIVEPAADAAA